MTVHMCEDRGVYNLQSWSESMESEKTPIEDYEHAVYLNMCDHYCDPPSSCIYPECNGGHYYKNVDGSWVETDNPDESTVIVRSESE